MTHLLAPAQPVQLHRAPASNHWRFVRAYRTTFAVIWSYSWLAFRARVFGRAYHEARILGTHRKNAKRVEETILALQGLFIKVGQLLSILANFLPDDFRHGLEALQDQVPPRPFEEIEARVLAEVGPIKDRFATFNKIPIASASLGQVHEATLKDGTRVAVKVQHRDIDETVRLDLLTIRRIMTIVQWFVPVQGLDAYYHQIKELLGQELDFALEADNIERIAKNFSADPEVRFALPVRALSTRHVLVTQFVEGKKVSDTAIGPAGGAAQKDLAKRLVRVYCQMIFVDGVYHADPHPGNVMVGPGGELVLLDFGAVAELSPSMRAGIPEFLEGVIRRDTERLIKALRTMGFLSLTSDAIVGERIIEYFHRRFQEDVRLESFNLKDIKIDPQKGLSHLLDLRKMEIGLKELSGSFHIPKDWVLLERTILLLFGTCSLLDAELNPMAIIQPYLQEFVLGSRDWTEIAVETVREMALSAITLPDDMKKYLTRAVRGELEVRVRGLEEGGRTLYVVGRQMIYTTIGVAAGFAGLDVDGRGQHHAAQVLYGVAIGAAVLLLLSSVFSRPRIKRS
jgi:predicted unusual protein kinase regulating ubiquinone biosynthesis (AarF/ABC1/UbiB family)